MKTVTVRELHARTGKLVREAAQHGEIYFNDARLLAAAAQFGIKGSNII